MRRLQPGHRGPSLLGREPDDGRQLLPRLFLVLRVQIGPAVAVKRDFPRRPASPQHLHDARVDIRRLRKPVPHRAPFAHFLDQLHGRVHIRVRFRVQFQLLAAKGAERAPSARVHAIPGSIRIGHPPQDIPLEIAGQQPVEVVGVPAASLKAGDEKRSDFRQCAGQGFASRGVGGDVEAESLGGSEEGCWAPRTAVGLSPQCPAIHQLDQRLQAIRATGAHSQVLACNIRQIEDRDAMVTAGPIVQVAAVPVLSPRRGQRSAHDAADPDGRPHAGLRIVLAQLQQLRDAAPKVRQKAAPFLLGVGPENGYRGLLTFRRRAPPAEAVHKTVQDGWSHRVKRSGERLREQLRGLDGK